MRLTIDSYIADISPQDWVAAIPKASSNPPASRPYSVPAAAAAARGPNTTPECHPRESMSRPPSAWPTRGPVSYPKMAPSRKLSPETRPTRGAAASIAGRTSELECSGASGW